MAVFTPANKDMLVTSAAEKILLLGPGDGSKILVNGVGLVNTGTNKIKALVYSKILPNTIQLLIITGNPGGGSFTITFSAQTTAAIAYNASASVIKAALEALSNIDAGDISVSGGPLPQVPVLIEWDGNNVRFVDKALMTTTDSLTGGTAPASAITKEQTGSTTPISVPRGWASLDGSVDGFGGQADLNRGGGTWAVLSGFTDQLCIELDDTPASGAIAVSLTYGISV